MKVELPTTCDPMTLLWRHWIAVCGCSITLQHSLKEQLTYLVEPTKGNCLRVTTVCSNRYLQTGARLFVRSRESEPQDWHFKLSHRFENWQTPRQQCCRDAWQISKWLDNSKNQTGNFETLQDLMARRLIGYWNDPLISYLCNSHHTPVLVFLTADGWVKHLDLYVLLNQTVCTYWQQGLFTLNTCCSNTCVANVLMRSDGVAKCMSASVPWEPIHTLVKIYFASTMYLIYIRAKKSWINMIK